MEDRDWLIIKVLNEQKNITKTAQALFISQPYLTTRIRHIEKRVAQDARVHEVAVVRERDNLIPDRREVRLCVLPAR